MGSEIVVGVDFGTTFSGVSWAVNAGNKQVNTITNWPNPSAGRHAESDKVPSIIEYVDGKPARWGYEAAGSEAPLRWFKLALEDETSYRENALQVEHCKKQIAGLNKQPVEVVTDYLKLLWGFTIKELQRRLGSDFTVRYKLRLVMSVPAIWSPAAKEKTKQAIRKATALNDDIEMIAEPQAAAIATLRDRHAELQNLSPGDCFVVCDAGGGTVDLISYEVQSLSPLKLKECAGGSGDFCGSTFLDESFKSWVIQQIGTRQWMNAAKIKPRSKHKMMVDFENEIKRSFQPSPDKEYTIELRGIEDDAAAGIRDEMITVKSTAIETIFDKTISGVKQLVHQQIQDVQRKTRKVKAVLLVGGFGESGYLHDQLEAAHSNENIPVLQVNRAWSAVSRGATMWAIHSVPSNPTITTHVSRYSFGVPSGSDVHWLINKGDEFEPGEELCHDLMRRVTGHGLLSSALRDVYYEYVENTKKYSFTEQLLYCSHRTPPTRSDSAGIKKLCTLTWQLMHLDLFGTTTKHKIGGTKYRDIKFTVKIVLKNADLSFHVTSDAGDTYETCEVSFPDM